MVTLNDPAVSVAAATTQPIQSTQRPQTARPVEPTDRSRLGPDDAQRYPDDPAAVVQLVRGARESHGQVSETTEQRRQAQREAAEQVAAREQEEARARRRESDPPPEVKASRSTDNPRETKPARDARTEQSVPSKELAPDPRSERAAPPDQHPREELVKIALAKSIAAQHGEQEHVDLYV